MNWYVVFIDGDVSVACEIEYDLAFADLTDEERPKILGVYDTEWEARDAADRYIP